MRLLIVFLFLIVSMNYAQETTPVIPDLQGMTVPDAAAVLNRVGLRLGEQQVIEWDGVQPENTITDQSPREGTELIPGTTVTVSVMRPLNVLLVYDDNDLTFINNAGQVFDASTVMFETEDGSRAFAAGRWERGATLPAQDCLQVWSVARTAGKDVDGCRAVQWMTTNDRNEHFWMAGRFKIMQEGLARGVCDPASTPNEVQTCSLYLAPSPQDTTEYLYFTYTANQLVIMNRSQGRWMPLDGVRLGENFRPSTPELFETADSVIGDLGFLAPNQCLIFSDSDETPIETCDVIARATLIPRDVFWRDSFRVRSGSSRERCPAVSGAERMICMVPRLFG